MSERVSVVSLLSTPDGEERASSVASRVAKRVEILRKWKAEGVPQDRLSTLPVSLRDAAKWLDEEYGIEPIVSPNEFTTTHRGWGGSVAEIQRLLEALNTRHQAPRRKNSASVEAATSRKEVQELKILLSRVTSQWHMARSKLTKLGDELEYLRALNADATGESGRLQALLDEKERELADLRRLLRQSGDKPRIAST